LARLLIKYGKEGPLSYLSHLELTRSIERSFRRAGINVRMSSGFNPRPKFSYGPALPVGTGSCAEYMLVDLEDEIPENELLNRISCVLPKGLAIYIAKYIEKKVSLVNLVQSASYRVSAEVNAAEDDIIKAIGLVKSQKCLQVTHKGKQKWVETSKAILDLSLRCRNGNTVEFYLLLSLGSQDSIRPEAVFAQLAEKLPEKTSCRLLEISRLEQFVNQGEPLMNILDFMKV